MWSKPDRNFVSESLRRLRRRVLVQGDPLFRVIKDGHNYRDFRPGPEDHLADEKAARAAARELALNLASTDVGSSVFVSERRELDGVQVLVGVQEFTYSVFGGFFYGR